MTISEKAMRGRNGFLFLNGKDSNNLIGHLQGEVAVLPSARYVHRENCKVIEALKVPFLGIIVPEAHCLYPEDLPKDVVPPAEGRPVNLVRADMASGYVYPFEHLAAYKAAGGVVYTGQDSHWTQPAALETYRALRGQLGRTHEFDLSYEPSLDAETADLTINSRQQTVHAERMQQIRTNVSYDTVFASRILNHGNVMVLHNPRGQGRCLAFGTSFSGRLLPAYASDFREVVFCYGTTVDPFMVALVEPECVICELPERFLHFPSLSVRGSSLVSLLLGLHDQKKLSKALVARPSSAPQGLRELSGFFSGAFAHAMGEPSRAFRQRLEALDPETAFKIALLEHYLGAPMNKTGLRLLLSGQFYNRGVLSGVFQMIDAQRLGLGELPLIPESENGYLAKIRLLLRAGLEARARAVLELGIATFGKAAEAEYFVRFLSR